TVASRSAGRLVAKWQPYPRDGLGRMHLNKAIETTAHRYSVACTLSVIHAIGLLGVVQPSSANESPTFEETACDLPGMTAELEGRFRCGFVRVPQVYSDDASGELRLFVAIAQSPR